MGDLDRALTIARLAMRLGKVRRVTQHEDGEQETDATHTVMLALLAMEMAPRVGCDAGLAVQFAVVHDLPEVYAGDTNTARQLSPEEAAAKAEREAAAVRQLSTDLGDARSLALLRRYEAQVEPEARLVRYLDKVVPKLTHFLNRGAALASLGITADEVLHNHARQGSKLLEQYPEMEGARRLFAAACDLVERGLVDGTVSAAPEPMRPGGGGRYLSDLSASERAAVVETQGSGFAPGCPMGQKGGR